jgi:hypothetical protein
LYSALRGVYIDVLNDLAVLKKDEATTNPVKEAAANEEFREQGRRKRNYLDG